ncbi:MAG: hypothetical protein QM667_02925 [Asticcacaulis sp.]
MTDWIMSTLPYKLTIEDFRQFRWEGLKARASHPNALWTFALSIGMILIVFRLMLWFVMDGLRQDMSVEAIVFALFVTLAFYGLYVWHNYHTVTLLLAGTRYALAHTITRIGPEGVGIFNPHHDSFHEWSRFVRVRLVGPLLVFYSREDAVVVVPKQGFTTERQRKVFFDLCCRHLAETRGASRAQDKA